MLNQYKPLKKMNPSFKKKWVKALLSGKYKQGKGRLCTFDTASKETRYCCLGVLRAIDGVKHPKGANLSDNMLKRYGMGYETADYLASVNDGFLNSESFYRGKRWPFERIAKWIERNL